MSAGTIFAAGQSDELRSFDLATGTNSSLAHTSPLGRAVVFAQNAEQQGWIEPAGEPRARVGARFQYLAASQEFVYEAFDQFGFPTLVARSIASGSERILWRRHPTVLFGPQDWQISPDGKSLAYWGPPPGVTFPEDAIPARTDTPFALNILSVQDATTRTLLSRPTGGLFATRIVWSPDSQRILYIAAGGNSRSFGPQVVDITSGESTRLFSESVAANLDVTADWLGGWDWSPDGRFIVFDATVEATHRLRWGGVTHNAVLAHGRR